MLSKEQKQGAILITLIIIGGILFKSNQLLNTVLGRFYLVSVAILATRKHPTAGLIVAGVILLMYMNTWYTEGFDNAATSTATTNTSTTTSTSTNPKQMDKITAETKMRSKSSNKSMYQQISTSAYTEPSSQSMVSGKQLGWAPF